MKFYHKDHIKCQVNGIEIKGQVTINKDGTCFICHNEEKADGRNAENKLGYKYSWLLGLNFIINDFYL